ncbi:MAG: helix-turn-helix transcriptional regulator [Candidatus Aminicenantes bacterium]|nr:helix-turn-helix transcriptional regulator [Candidatus Aminicenantes bacterium]
MILLSRSEEIVLLTIWKLKDNAYGVSLRETISKLTNHEWSFGSVYKPLKQLLHKGYVKKSSSEPRSERGGRSRFLYTLTPAGHEALRRSRKIYKAFWSEETELAFE